MAADGSIAIRLRPGTAKVVDEALRTLLARVTDMKPLNQQLARYMVADTRRRFSTKLAPDGTPWAPLKESTEALRARADMVYRLNDRLSAVSDRHLRMRYNPGDTLVASGALKKSISVGYIGAREFEVRATAPYAAAQQLGISHVSGYPGFTGKAVPARPFLGFSEANKKTIGRKIREYIEKGTL
jgi:phage virion morphogenesis protein